ncbi:MAG: methyl-accepting chemotaxis protein [Thermodesulfobacteriota bacterium]|nr:methyl-accepting chemotaxis protein [Thermodesulfobacteriota bacterium]
MSIAIKLMGSFFAMAMLCATVGGLGIYGINGTNNALTEVSDVRLVSVQNLGLMLEQLNAIKAEERTLTIPDLTIEQRHQALSNIKMYSQKLTSAQERYAALPKNQQEIKLWLNVQKDLDNWQTERIRIRKLVDQIHLDNIGTLNRNLTAMFMDLFEWVSALGTAIEHETHFTGQLDHTKCGFGRWLQSFKTNNTKLREALERLKLPHEELHAIGAEIETYIAEGDIREANLTYTHIIMPVLAVIKDMFGDASDIVKQEANTLNQVTKIALGSEKMALDAVSTSLNRLYELNNQLTDQSRNAAIASASRNKTITITTIVLGVFFALGFGLITSRRLSVPLKKAVTVLDELGNGHLDNRLEINSTDEVGQMVTAMNSFADDLKNEVVTCMEKLAQGDLTFTITPKDQQDILRTTIKQVGEDLTSMIQQIQGVSDQIANGASQVSNSSQALSNGATQQASSIEEISASMTQMASQTRNNADSATTASELSASARKAADDGVHQMGEMTLAMNEINESGQNIAKIIKVIDEIAFQTNLLALNAAVEAARAGQHGKGFAVVAEEVRNLASRSAKAAAETSNLIETSVNKAKHGQQVVENTSSALTEITDRVQKVTDLVGEIASASQEQANGIEQINQGIVQIDQVTQQNTASAEESAAASDELTSQANTLRQLLSRFQVGSGSHAAQPQAQISFEPHDF